MDNQLNTSAVDLLPSRNRFVATSRLHSRMHRYQLLLSKYWWLLLLIFAVVLVPVYLVTSAAAPRYKSSARMWLTGMLNLSEGRVYNEDVANFMGTQSELLRSPTIKQRALAKLSVPNPPPGRVATAGTAGVAQWTADSAAGAWQKVAASGAPDRANGKDDFPFKLQVRESPKSSILELQAIGREPKSTRAFLDHVMAEYLEFKKQVRSKTADRALSSVSDQVRELSGELQAQQEKMHAFQVSNNVVLLQEQGNSAASYLGSVNKQLALLQTELQLLKMLEPEQLLEIGAKPRSNLSGEALPGEASAKEIIANLSGSQAELFKARQQANLLKFKRDELSEFLRPTHPKMVKLNEDIAVQEKLVQVSRDESLRRLADRRKALELEIKNLEKASAEWDVKAVDASRKMADYEQIRHGLERLQAAYDRLLGVIQTVDVGKTLDQENVGIMEPASVALPINQTTRNMLLGVAAAMFFSLGFLWFVGAFDDRFASVDELRSHFPEPVIGQIPDIPLRRPKGKLEMEALEKNRFEFVEAFRGIRSSLLFMGDDEARPKSMIVTSAVPKEGKSTVALYLAATIAMGGSRVLLIDADMRRACLHKYFGVSFRPGLAEILGGDSGMTAANDGPPRDVNGIIGTSVANLWFLPAGEAKRNPGELVLSPCWEKFLRDVAPRYDFILVDTPPILAADDASSLAQKLDGVLMVVRGSFTSARIAEGALDAFYQVKAKVLGLIYNRAVSTAYVNYQQYKHGYQWRPPEGKRSRWIPSRTPAGVEA
jgi:succinoglycan biosynthesis transport protein ExoP